jgi:hypothetical protein
MARPGFPVPEDIIESGSGIRDWVNCTFFGDTVDGVAAKRTDYFKKYPPQGYDTHAKSKAIARHPDGYYYIKITRWSTCS